jgi:hypothetical protein
VNAYTVLQDHHKMQRAGQEGDRDPGGPPERQDFLDDLLVELDIHFRIRTTGTIRVCQRPAR